MPQQIDAETMFERLCFLLICLPAWLDFLRSLALGSQQRCSRLTSHRSHRGFLACQFSRKFSQTYPWESLHSNNSKKSPVQSDLKHSERVGTCTTEVLAQKKKTQDTNLFLFLLGIFSLCFHFPSFTWDDLAENSSSTIFKCSSSIWLPKGQTQSLFYYCLCFFSTEPA